MKNLLSLLILLLCNLGLNAQVINEVLYDPIMNDGSVGSNGEWIELAGAPGTDMEGWILSDGDWTIVFPAGVSIQADGYLVVGFNGSAEGGPMDFNLTSCGCIGGSSAITLTNGGEFLVLFDQSQTFVDGVIYENPSTTNTPGTGDSSANLPGGGTITIPADNATTDYFEIPTNSGNGVSIGRVPDETGPFVLSTTYGGPSPGGNNTLPVSLISFNTNLEHEHVIISWVTSSETNNDFFTIQHSTDGKVFTSVGRIQGSGTTSVENEYDYIHRKLSEGVNYYRLKQTDFNGQFEIFPTQTILIKRNESKPKLFPNVSSDVINVVFGNEVNAKYTVYSLDGRVVLRGDFIEQVNQFDVSGLHAGHYLLQMNIGSRIITERIVKK